MSCSRPKKQARLSTDLPHLCAAEVPKGGTSKDCKRRFRDAWKEAHTWLRYEEVKDTMYCQVCREAYFGQEKCVPFVEGTTNFKLSVIQKHEKTSAHQRLLNKSESERQDVAQSTKTKKKETERESRSRLALLFKTVYQIQVSKLSFSQFPVLISQQIQNGVPLKGRYTNHHHVVPGFSKYIAMSMINDIIADVHQVEHFGIVLDDVSEVTGAKQDAVYITYLKDCRKITKHLGLISNTSGVGIVVSLVEMLAKYGLPFPFEKLLSLTTDGRDVHQATNEGLESALQSEAPVLFSLHCLAHKLESLVRLALREHREVQQCCNLLHRLFSFLRELRKKTAQCDDISVLLTIVDIDEIAYLPNLKWFALNTNVLCTVVEKWSTIVVFLVETFESIDRKLRLEASEIIAALKSSTFLAYLHLLKDVFCRLQELQSRISNSNALPSYLVCGELTSASSTLLDQVLLGPHLIHVMQELQEKSGFFQGISVSTDFDIESFQSDAEELCHKISYHLSLLGSETSTTSKFAFLDPQNWPVDSRSLLAVYGIQSVRDLSLEMDSVLHQKYSTDAVQEWCSFKSFVINSLAPSLRRDFVKFSAAVVSRFSRLYPSICTMLTAAALLSPSCEVARRGFDELCQIKASRKNMLTDDTLWQTMVININGVPLEDWDPDPVVDFWLKTSLRRPNHRTKEAGENRSCVQGQQPPLLDSSGLGFSVVDGNEPGTVIFWS
ncbi:zinc finger protein 862-like [Ornithodoros turicata]|uniref:zinc finger protein 862-like n=1 Tax=Ornithodoros turicata TaxID=34597 RepID=UPI0031399217